MEAHAARSRLPFESLAALSREPSRSRGRAHRTGRHLHGARRGRPLRLGHLSQLHGRDRRFADRQLGRLRQLHECLARREFPAGAPQHAHLHARLAGHRGRRRRGPLEFPRPRLSWEVDRALPRGPALGGPGRALDHRLALAPRLALQRRQLDARPAPSRQRARLAARRRASRGGRTGSAAMARPPQPRAHRRSRSCTRGGSCRSRW